MHTTGGNAREHAYRADIDGLRAIAVLSVVAFHSFPGKAIGGYVGVDVFFVISGFLITSILIGQIDSGHYSVLDFYGRRIRRIFPALGLVLAATLAFGWIALLPDEFMALGRHVAGGAGFVSNMVLRQEAGYFDTSGEMKPLLHLWSLGVEEQFYLVWPVVLYVASRLNIRRAPMLIVGAIASFASCLWLMRVHPISAFYLPVPRFWELLAGAALASMPNAVDAVRRMPKAADIVSLAGFSLVAATIAFLPPDTPFPGWFAIPPVIGAVMLIAAGPKAWLNRIVLSHPAFVAVGLISYPLYLWHWPVLAFGNILYAHTPPPLVRIGLVATAFVLAVLTYLLVERPLRFGGFVGAKVALLCSVVFVTGACGYRVFRDDGVPSRAVVAMNANMATTRLGQGNEFVDSGCDVSAADAPLFMWCYHDKREVPTAAVWGDSHANALYWGMVRDSDASMRWLHIGRPSCPPMLGVTIDAECDRANKAAAAALVADSNIKLVLITGAKWAITDKHYPSSPGGAPATDGGEAGLAASIELLQRAHKRVAFAIDNPGLPDPKQCMATRVTSSGAFNVLLARRKLASCSMTLDAFQNSTATYRQMVDRLKARFPSVVVYDPTPVLCDKKANKCSMWHGRDFLYSYGDHISDVANGLIAQQLLPILRSSTSHAASFK